MTDVTVCWQKYVNLILYIKASGVNHLSQTNKVENDTFMILELKIAI